MPRPFKINEVPVAPFNLRETGPLTLDDVEKRLGGRAYRAASSGKADGRATIDPSPCPTCAASVEWAYTSKRALDGGYAIKHLYARCRGKAQHRWDFRHMHLHPPTPPKMSTDIEVTKAPQVQHTALPPLPGTDALAQWVDAQLEHMRVQLEKLNMVRQLVSEINRPMAIGAASVVPASPPTPAASPDTAPSVH